MHTMAIALAVLPAGVFPVVIQTVKRAKVDLKNDEATCEKDFATPDGLPRPGSRALHQRPFLWQQQVVLGLVDQVPDGHRTALNTNRIKAELIW